MATIGSDLFDSHGRPLQDVVGEDSSGNKYVLITNSSGQLEVALIAGSARIGTVSGIIKQVRVSKVIDASIGAYAALDVVNDDDCSTTATVWTFPGMARTNGETGAIVGAMVFNETEGVTPRLTLRLYTTSSLSSQLTDNSLSTQNKADRLLFVRQIDFPAMESLCSTSDASTTESSPSTVGGLPLLYKCDDADTALYGILLTRDAFTQTATDDITIVLLVEHF